MWLTINYPNISFLIPLNKFKKRLWDFFLAKGNFSIDNPNFDLGKITFPTLRNQLIKTGRSQTF